MSSESTSHSSAAEPGTAREHRVGSFIREGQRQEVWVRAVHEEGRWHNALVFRRDGKLSTPEAILTGLEWHLPPDEAAQRAAALDEKEWIELFERALRPRPPLV